MEYRRSRRTPAVIALVAIAYFVLTPMASAEDVVTTTVDPVVAEAGTGDSTDSAGTETQKTEEVTDPTTPDTTVEETGKVEESGPATAATTFGATTQNETQDNTESTETSETTTTIPAGGNGHCPSSATARVVDIERTVNGVSVPRLRNNVTEGSTVTVSFKIDPDCADPVEVSLVSYKAPKAVFDAAVADKQVIFDSKTGTFAPSSTERYTLSVNIPDCFFQVDLVQGAVIQQLGPKGSSNFYSPQGRLIDSAEGGDASCPDVKGVTIERPKVQAQVLANTGVETFPLAFFGAGLVALGWQSRRMARQYSATN